MKKLIEKRSKHILLLVTLLLTSAALSANDYSAYQIADSLKKDAVAVVRDYTAIYKQTDKSSATYTVTEVITILNKHGESFANFQNYGDKFTELKDFSGIVRDASGKVVRKIKRSDLTFSSVSDGSTMASDNYYIWYECQHPVYPFTVEYTYQKRFKNGIISYPPFAPCGGFQVAIEKASGSYEFPADMELRYHSNYDSDIRNEKADYKNSYTLSLANMKAKPYEPLAPSYREILPRVLFAPNDFCYDSKCGNMADWKSYGHWVSQLLKDRDALPAAEVARFKAMTAGSKSDREKVQILYDYLQQNTRYVSIQLGIGGLQPADAASVLKNGFGDCKGLSNLMKAMLKAVDIPSNYCEISMKERALHPKFSNVSQTDHAILLVPLADENIWLECTSQTLPFGYIHDDIAGHDALVIGEGGKESYICRLPTYTDKQNNKETKLTITIAENGSAKGEITIVEHLHSYASASYAFNSNEREKQVVYLNKNLKLPHTKFGTINTTDNEDAVPSCSISTDFEFANYASKTGARLFIPLCPLNKGSLNVFSADKREWDILINNGFCETDSIIITLPELYKLESISKNTEIKSEIGEFKIEITHNDNQIIYTQNLEVYSGRYSKNSYKEAKDFFTQISAALKGKLVIRKE